jgi:hypothetical protein
MSILFYRVFLLDPKTDIHSHSAKYQNIVTPDDERGALSPLVNLESTAVAWVWIADWP